MNRDRKSPTFRFCIVSGFKGLSSTWVVQNSEAGMIVGTKTGHGHLRAVLSPSSRTALSIALPPSLHRSTSVNQTFVLTEDRERDPYKPFDLAMSVLFPGEQMNPTRRAPAGRNGRSIAQISAAERHEAVEVSIGFSPHPPAGLADILSGFGDLLSVQAVPGDRFLYVCQATRRFPFVRDSGALDTDRLPLSATGLPGLFRGDPPIPGLLQILQTAPSQMYGS